MGKTIARILSLTLCPAIASHTARQTSTLHSTPLKKAAQKGSEALRAAILTAFWATAPWFMSGCWESSTTRASPTAPTALARKTTSQLRSTSAPRMRPPAQAITSRLLPVKSSAPATTTKIRPSEKLTPPSTRLSPKDRPASLVTRVK
nr:hypothetical protein [Calidithermus chliarophilus]